MRLSQTAWRGKEHWPVPCVFDGLRRSSTLDVCCRAVNRPSGGLDGNYAKWEKGLKTYSFVAGTPAAALAEDIWAGKIRALAKSAHYVGCSRLGLVTSKGDKHVDLQLKGKRAFVSGSSSGIGLGIALELAAEGCDVVVHGRDKKRTEDTARKVEAKGVKSLVTLGDLADEQEADKVCDTALQGFGGIDILINNCGRTLRYDNPDWSELKSSEWIKSFEVNFMAGIRLARRFVPGMKEKGWGRIVNVSSTTATHVWGILVDYGAPKASVNKITADMSKTLGPHGITVNAIIPGTIMTPAIEDYMKTLKKQNGWGDDPEENERRYTKDIFPQSVPRLGKLRDTGTLVTFLASPLAGYINGAYVRIDGGLAQFM